MLAARRVGIRDVILPRQNEKNRQRRPHRGAAAGATAERGRHVADRSRKIARGAQTLQ